jgi:FkbM family methyltransferase
MTENNRDEQRQIQVDPDLIFDIGLHKGEDTSFYLEKGFRVIAFEANPDLANHCRLRFQKQIEKEQLTIIEGAITDTTDTGELPETITFYKNLDDSVWGTVCENWAKRNERLGTRNEAIKVQVIDFRASLQQYGTPYYMKIDIEGMDTVCLKSLLKTEARPSYISIESEKVSFENLVAELELFKKLGYTHYKAVQQSGISKQVEPSPVQEGRQTHHRFSEGASGLFGRDLPGRWESYDRIMEIYKKIFFQYEYFGDSGKWRRKWWGRVIREVVSTITGKPLPGWYDTHARHRSVSQ